MKQEPSADKNGHKVIQIEDVCRVYRDSNYNPVEALSHINLDIEQGEFLTLIGPSGCGKTTLLRLIAGLDRPEAGKIFACGAEISGPSHERGYIFQQPSLFPWETVSGNIALGLKARRVYDEKKHLIQPYIDIIGLNGFENAYPHEISGGMAQRAAIVRSLINEPQVLLLDEPLGALDAFTRVELQQQLLNVWRATGATFVMVTHDVDEAITLSGRIVIMTPRPGKIEHILKVDIQGERGRNNDDFITLRKKILEELHLVISRPRLEYEI